MAKKHQTEVDGEFISNTKLKQAQKDIEEVGKKIVELPLSQINSFNFPKPLHDAIITARGFSHSAYNRQLKFIRKLLAKEDMDAVQHTLNLFTLKASKDNAIFNKLEVWRDKLIAGDDSIIDSIAEINYDVDRQYIRQLVKNAQKEARQEKPIKSGKLLFKYLRETVEKSS